MAHTSAMVRGIAVETVAAAPSYADMLAWKIAAACC